MLGNLSAIRAIPSTSARRSRRCSNITTMPIRPSRSCNGVLPVRKAVRGAAAVDGGRVLSYSEPPVML